MKVYGVTGWKNSGKTGLMERLIDDMTAFGLRVSTVKHAHHRFDVDQPGKDSYRHRAAGAEQVMLVTSKRWVLMDELRDHSEPPLEEMLAKMRSVDLVLIEGYKRDRHPKIEACRMETRQRLIAIDDPTIQAVATDSPEAVRAQLTDDRLVFHLDDTAQIAAFIRKECGFE
ncbi:molybdopterin-guanine dinucleotide biosynthesis protein B [Aliiruegeria sabulilitoris]|uniref:molybdopterin-guanine dinucleotide biosynthesis protein B n=1 Tax=Aliiruegeria sabulilitoris TaxID=1510458 RepID=UPI00082E11CD|nr:molybdopterin-guanine dinucleotide biosynthesis protein B [Aliiruegeria sabulilitoris]NDR56799.1 molybdopterin-guanine dinucleotide biosynthesis protein B [Pseudoruegeria sp. M32A2M]